MSNFYSFLTFDPKKVFRFFIAMVFPIIIYLLFVLFQHPAIYQNTLAKITHTYSRDTMVKINVWKVDEPYYFKNKKNLLSWDAGIYNDIRCHYYSDEDQTYAFFPLFPMLWKFLNIDIEYISFFNYLLFSLAIIILSSLFLNPEKLSDAESIIVFMLALTLPMVVVIYLPYAEAVYILTFSVAAWGWIKNKYWMYFIFMTLFAMSRPVFMNAGLAFIIADVLLFAKHRNFFRFLKEMFLKIVPLVLGTIIVFYLFYLNSGNFLKYFETVEKWWQVHFQIPSKITDWSIEGFGMNVFAIFFVIILSAILLANNFFKVLKSKGENDSSEENRIDQAKEYFFNVSLLYFCGVFVTLIFFQNGSMNGLCRYVFSSPFFFVFLFHLYSEYNQIKIKKILLFFIPATVLSFLMLIGFEKYEPQLNFSDSGYLTFLLSFTYLFFMRRMNALWRYTLLAIIIFYNLVWVTYLYNMFLCNAWIYT
jgi:hypothetical protein